MNMSSWSIEGTNWFVEGIPIAFWRSSRWPKSLYPFWMTTDDNQLTQLTRETISSSEISFWLDKLSGRNIGYHKTLLEAPLNSDTRRKLMYATDLLISGIIKHDVGQKGLISIAQLPDDWQNVGSRFLSLEKRFLHKNLVHIPRDSNILLLDMSKYELTENFAKKYELAVDPSFRIELSASDLSLFKSVVEIVAQNIDFEQNLEKPKAIMIAIDAMRRWYNEKCVN